MTIRLEIDLCEAEGLSERNFTDHAESETKTFSEAHLHPAGAWCPEEPFTLGVSKLPREEDAASRLRQVRLLQRPRSSGRRRSQL